MWMSASYPVYASPAVDVAPPGYSILTPVTAGFDFFFDMIEKWGVQLKLYPVELGDHVLVGLGVDGTYHFSFQSGRTPFGIGYLNAMAGPSVLLGLLGNHLLLNADVGANFTEYRFGNTSLGTGWGVGGEVGLSLCLGSGKDKKPSGFLMGVAYQLRYGLTRVEYVSLRVGTLF